MYCTNVLSTPPTKAFSVTYTKPKLKLGNILREGNWYDFLQKAKTTV